MNENTNAQSNDDHGKVVVITAGPTNERIDAVMKITNMATGALGCTIAETLLDPDHRTHISKIIYLTTAMSRKPRIPTDLADRLDIRIGESAEEMIATLKAISQTTHVDAVVHTAAVGDYKARLSVRAEDIADQIADRQEALGRSLTRDELRSMVINPSTAQNDAGKMPSTFPHLYVQLCLTPKIISFLRGWFPDALLIGCKLLDGVTSEHLVSVASTLRQKNRMNYIIANDLAHMDADHHPALLIGNAPSSHADSFIVDQFDTDAQIAHKIATLITQKI